MLDCGHIDRDRHPEHRSHRRTSLLRHFLAFPIAPLLLPGGVAPCPAARPLIPGAGASVRGPAGDCRALAGAINIAVIAPIADAHQHAAAPAAIQPVGLLPLLHPTPPQHWTAPGCAGLNDVAEDRPHRHRTAGGPGVLNGSRAFFAWAQALSLERNVAARCDRDNHHQKWMPELLPLTAADCASSTSETTSEKPKKTQNPPPGHRRSNRAYPQNYAVFNPRSHSDERRWVCPAQVGADRPLFLRERAGNFGIHLKQ